MDRQHQIKQLAGILFIAVLPLLNPAYGADKNTRLTSPHGDEGYFGGGSPGNTNAMILWPRDDHNIVRKFRPTGSVAPSPLAFKLWVNPGRSGGFPVNLDNAGAFCSFLQNIGKDPDKGACICEDDPGRPYTGVSLGACAGVNFPACNPLACAPGTPEQPCLEPIPPETEWLDKYGLYPSPNHVRKHLLTGHCSTFIYSRCGKQEETEVCGDLESRPCNKDSWETGEWQPEAEPAQICLGTTETQTRTVTKTDPHCAGGTPPDATRQVAGTKRCPDTRPVCRWRTGTWSPSPVTKCEGASFTQRRNVTLVSGPNCRGGIKPPSSRTATGTKYCRPPKPPGPGPVTRPTCRWTTGTWTPARSKVCAGETLAQTRSVRKITTSCEGGARPASSRSVTGTKYCPPTCRWRVGSWSPSPSTTCNDRRISQSRSVTKITANCVGGTQPASTRTVSGSKRCPTCASTSWSPGQGTVCAGSSFTQTRTLKNCSKDSRSARGTKCCGTVTTWSPGSATKCGAFTQTRTNACGKTESRQAKGTASWCGCSWGPYTPSSGTVCKGKKFTQKSYYSCAGRTNAPRTRTATGTKNCPKTKTCSDGQHRCSGYTRYLCRNGKWKVIAHGPYACFTP